MINIAIVDENDQVIGAAERAVAQAQGLRHRIVRVFLYNSAGKVLLQRRHPGLKDNPGKWDQSVGGHVDTGEDYEQAALRETKEELGIQLTGLQNVGKFYVERQAPSGLARRFHTVFTGKWDGPIHYDKTEIAEVAWLLPKEIEAMHRANPEHFTQNFASAYTLLQEALTNPLPGVSEDFQPRAFGTPVFWVPGVLVG